MRPTPTTYRKDAHKFNQIFLFNKFTNNIYSHLMQYIAFHSLKRSVFILYF